MSGLHIWQPRLYSVFIRVLVQNEKGMRTQNRIFGSLFIAAGALLSGASR